MKGRWWMKDLSTVSERKVETIENSEPTLERSISGNGIVDIELFAAVIQYGKVPDMETDPEIGDSLSIGVARSRHL